MTDEQTQQEIEQAVKDAGLAVGITAPSPGAPPPPKRIGLHRLFNRDSQLPINGVWFRVDVVEEEKLVLVPVSFTKKFSKRDR
jgi:hypothetical protein